MSNSWDLLRSALSEAKEIQTAADDNATQMARVLDGRLKRVMSEMVLCNLKRQLRDFDMVTKRWKNHEQT